MTIPYVPCTCLKCRVRPLAPGTVCPCKECQPGPGIDYLANRSKKAKERDTRMKVLLTKTELTEAENEELEGLLHWCIYRS